MATRVRPIIGLMVAAVVLGVFTLSPVAAHFTTNTKHLGKHAWQQFIKAKADTRFVNERDVLSAVVNPDGSLARGDQAVSSEKLSMQTGRYVVTFGRNVSNCAYSGVLGDAVGSPLLPNQGLQGFISLAPRHQTPTAIFVWTSSTGNVDADRGFHLTVTC